MTRVAREVGTEGKLGGQAQVKGVGGVWKDLTDNVNLMAANLTGQVRNIAEVTTAVANGDLSKKITVAVEGEILELKSTINTMVDQLNSFASEVTRVAREVGTEGKLGGQAQVRGVAGTWKDLTDNVNMMAANLTGQVRNIAEVTTAVANGDLSKKITVDVSGEILELKNTINTMVDQLNSFASEVTRVAREVGTEGKLGGQAQVRGVAGTWKDLTDNVNMMAANLTGQVRGIASVVTAVAKGDLKRKLSVDAKGEIAALADTINEMIDTLATFADQVTNVAREVGVEGKLGGQARVPGAAGLWRDLTDNVNQLAANLTTQVRAIAEVATAVTKGDLTRSITVEASGEVASLKDNINEMIRNLRDTTLKNAEQDWLKTNLARFTRMLQGERDLVTVSNLILSEIAPLVNAQRGVFYVVDNDEGEPVLDLVASYAFTERKNICEPLPHAPGPRRPVRVREEAHPADQCAGRLHQHRLGLGEAPPLNIIVLPVLFEQEVKAVIELASFSRFSETHQSFLDQLTESIGIVLNTIAANMRTEGLLKQSQLLTGELQSQQEELKKTNDRLEQQAATLRQSEELLRQQQDELQPTNEELEEKARLLELQKREVEAKNREVSRRQDRARGEGRAAVADLALQVAVPRQHEPRAAHAAELPADPVEAPDREPGRQPLGQAAGVRQDDPRRRLRPSRAHQRHPRPLQDRVRHGQPGDRRGRLQRPRRAHGAHLPADRRGARARLPGRDRRRPAARAAHRREAAAAGAAQPALERLQVHRERAASRSGSAPPRARRCAPESDWIALSVTRHRHRHRRGQAAHHLRGLPAGRRHHEPQVRRHRPRPRDQPRDRAAARRRDRRREPAGPGHDLHAVPAVRAAGDERGGVPPRLTPRKATARSMGRSASVPMALSASADDRHAIASGDHVVLIVEDDAMFASVLLELAREQGFKGLIASDGAAALALAHRYKPHAITLDIGLPDMDGWALLDLLKHDRAPATCRSTSSRSTTRRSAACGPAPSASSRSRSTATR